MKISMKKSDIVMITCHILLLICLITLTIRASNLSTKVLFGMFIVFHAISSFKDTKKRVKKLS